LRRLTVTADDFGLSESVNTAVELAHLHGTLNAASLMVAGPAAEDAVRRARALPSLAVGLHLVVIDGPAMLPASAIPDLVDASGHFPSDQLRLGINYFFRPRVRLQLAAEIRAQFAAFAATGLKLDHVDAHKHMHLHPTVGRLVLDIGREFGLPRLRIPAEPPSVLARCGTPPTLAARALFAWTGFLRGQARRRRVATNDHCFGISWTGHMTKERLVTLLRNLPGGSSEIYLHPAARPDSALAALMPGYDHLGEYAALLDPEVRIAVADIGSEVREAAGSRIV
jgi:chitin disaccharide deacetylase